MNFLLFTLIGTPVLYYGDEIGMGDNIYLGDRNGVRTPMQWTPDRNAGFSAANAQRLYLPLIVDPEYHHETVNVEVQQRNPNSLLRWTKQLIALRKRHRAFGWGTTEFLSLNNKKVIAFIRHYEEEHILVVANLSGLAQYLELDLSKYRGSTLIELFGQTTFPPIGELPYLITLAPYNVYSFSLVQSTTQKKETKERPEIALKSWNELFLRENESEEVKKAIFAHLESLSWYDDPGRLRTYAEITDSVPLVVDMAGRRACYLLIIENSYSDKDADVHAFPVAYAEGEAAQKIATENAQKIIAYISLPNHRQERGGVLYDATEAPIFYEQLLRTLLDTKNSKKNLVNGLHGVPGKHLAEHHNLLHDLTCTKIVQTGYVTNYLFKDKCLLKFFHAIAAGINLDIGMRKYLSEKTQFTAVLPFLGAVVYKDHQPAPVAIAALLGYQPYEASAWNEAMDELDHFFNRVIEMDHSSEEDVVTEGAIVGDYLGIVRLIGQRLAQFHQALAKERVDRAFFPESFTPFYLHSQYQTIRTLIALNLQQLRQQLQQLPQEVQLLAQKVLNSERLLMRFAHLLIVKKFTSQRIRCHGNLGLDRLLFTGKDILIVDFEREARDLLVERIVKSSPLYDIAALLYSFRAVAYVSLKRFLSKGGYSADQEARLRYWIKEWLTWTHNALMDAYLKEGGEASFFPKIEEEREYLLQIARLKKLLRKLREELLRPIGNLPMLLEGIASIAEDYEKTHP